MAHAALRFSSVLLLLAGCAELTEIELPPELPGDLLFPPAPDTPAADAETWYADCGTDLVFAMADLLPNLAEGMVHQRIPYAQTSPDEWRDCSGNFLRLSSYVASACPAGLDHLAAPPGIADYSPDGSNVTGLEPLARSSRDLARWYHEQGQFVPVWYDDEASVVLDQYRYLIKPGAVLWFARKRPVEANGLDQLFGRNIRETHIRHVGTVVRVELDDEGQTVSYAMYHGRNRERLGSITDDHRDRGTGGGPPFGNGDEYLVGIGTLLPIVAPPGESVGSSTPSRPRGR